ncbi:hypothetical protein ABN078_03980 [Providencia huaxiensis]|uniref:hypothetical protein n=1 Tax=Providencia huaxiensis TaxID=2027290 RepID=UPI0032DAAECF
MWLINGALRDKRIYILLIMAFLGGMNHSRADYNPVETLRNIDGYFYENKYGSSIFGRVITDYFYLVMKEKKQNNQ